MSLPCAASDDRASTGDPIHSRSGDTKKKDRSSQTRLRIISAARQCFDRYGDQRVSLEEVSAHAKVHRQSVYRLFKNREGLRKAVLFHCIQALIDVVRAEIEDCSSLEEAVVLGTLVTVAHCRADPTLAHLIVSNPRIVQQRVSAYLPIESYFETIWKPLFLKARRVGEIDGSWSYSDFSQWLRGIQFIIMVHDELTPGAQKRLLKHFVRPCFR